MAKQNNTGLTLSEARGPLTNLLSNLSGENGAEWLSSLKLMLRGAKPKLQSEVHKTVEKLYSKELAKEKVQGWGTLLMTIPAVHDIHIIEKDDEDEGIMNIMVHSCLGSFLHISEEQDWDTAVYYWEGNGTIIKGKFGGEKDDDPTFNTWSQDKYDSIVDFARALIELGDMYNKYIPDPIL
ncbi:hypothetical protein IT402_02600 [Candidatus Nomurabacteria bacterium]|nr:hypothetical protein [Candidatus Nomurabacteria bacterium]